jgi:putative endonuclease
MAAIYILYSEKLAKYYTGSCNDLQKRLEEHRHKVFKDSYTSKTEDWILCFSCEGLAYTQARAIESHIKRMKSKTYIENLLKFPEIILRLKNQYQ